MTITDRVEMTASSVLAKNLELGDNVFSRRSEADDGVVIYPKERQAI